jgi:hypothetical protein
MKILVCGGRDYTDYDRLEDELNLLWRVHGDFTIISGMARGADSLAVRYAEQYNCPLEKFPALWDVHGKAAGLIRNQQMLDEGKPDLVVAFPGGRGTAHMIKIARKADVEVQKIEN